MISEKFNAICHRSYSMLQLKSLSRNYSVLGSGYKKARCLVQRAVVQPPAITFYLSEVSLRS